MSLRGWIMEFMMVLAAFCWAALLHTNSVCESIGVTGSYLVSRQITQLLIVSTFCTSYRTSQVIPGPYSHVAWESVILALRHMHSPMRPSTRSSVRHRQVPAADRHACANQLARVLAYFNNHANRSSLIQFSKSCWTWTAAIYLHMQLLSGCRELRMERGACFCV